MKTEAALKIMARTVERLGSEAGLIAIHYSSCRGEKLNLQCYGKDLRMYMEKNNLEYNYKDDWRLGYETEDYLLFEYVGEEKTDKD